MKTIKMIILASSRKYNGKCVAGIEVESGRWIRLTSRDEDHHFAVPSEKMRYVDQSEAKVLDIISTPVDGAFADLIPEERIGKGEKLQPENYVLCENEKIVHIGTATLDGVLALHPVDPVRYIFGSDFRYITEENKNFHSLGGSLLLVKAQNLRLWPNERNNIKADFTHIMPGFKEGRDYKELPVTDPEFDHITEEVTYDNAYLVMSMGTPIENRANGKPNYYKFVASILVC
ncbi:MAG: hypothetical protein LIO99_14765 [Clostridiales bacterium]|nr:hypothetical protein [Clostridiales bacterium]